MNNTTRRLRFYLILSGIVAVMIIWRTQPHFGWNFCLTKGLMREIDFIEEMRPAIVGVMDRKLVVLKQYIAEGKPWWKTTFKATDVPKIRAETRRLFDALKKCVAERGRKYCRYVGPDDKGSVRSGTEHSDYVFYNQRLFRYVDKTLTGYIKNIPKGKGGNFAEYTLDVQPIKGFGIHYPSFPGFGCWTDPAPSRTRYRRWT